MKRLIEEYGTVTVAAVCGLILIMILMGVGLIVNNNAGNMFNSFVNTNNDTVESVVYKVEYNSISGKKLSVGSVSGVLGSTKEVKPIAKVGYTAPASQTVTWDDPDMKIITFLYTPIEYKLTFDYAGGNANNPATYTIESDEIVLNVPTRTGYNFTGWTGPGITNPTLDVKIPQGSSGDRKYVATWNVNSYKYNIVYESSSGLPLGSDSVTAEFGTTKTISAPEKTGYVKPADQQVVWDVTDPKVIKFIYTPVEYNINYSLDSGTLSNPTTKYTIESNDIKLQTPIKNGYTFTGWVGSNGQTPSKNVVIPKGSTGEKNYTAKWAKNSYTLKFDANGGSVTPTSKTVPFGDAYGNLPTPTRAEFTFNGWFTEKIGGTKVDQSTVMGAASKTLYAHWTAIEYTAYFNGNGGSDGTPIKGPFGTKFSQLPVSTRVGYAFDGWYTQKQGGTKIDTTTTMPSGGATYYAHWNANKVNYVVKHRTMNLDGASYSDYSIEKLAANADSTVTPSVMSINGYTAPAQQTITVAPDGSSVVTYDYARNKYTYQVNNATGFTLNNATPNGSYFHGTTINLDGTVKPGYTFIKWTSNNSNIVFENNIKATSFVMPILTSTLDKLTITPQIGINTYTISYDLNGGTLSSPNPSSYTIETRDFTLNKPTRPGYKFIGWTGSNGTTPQTEVTIKQGTIENLSYVANWEKVDLSITYELNGGTNHKDNPSIYQVGSQVIVLKDATKTGYNFAGWFLDSGFKQRITEIDCSKYNAPITLYAKWTAKQVVVNFNSNDGTNKRETRTYTYDQASSALTLPKWTRTGYDAIGYATTSSGAKAFDIGQAVDNQFIIANEGTLNLYVKWEAQAVKINIYKDDGTGQIVSLTAKYDTTTVLPGASSFSRIGYTPSYFSTTVGGSKLYSLGQTLTNEEILKYVSAGKLDLHVVYNAIPYNLTYNLNGGTLAKANPSTYTIETPTFVLNNPSKTGYIFNGWGVEKQLSLKTDFTLDKQTTIVIRGTSDALYDDTLVLEDTTTGREIRKYKVYGGDAKPFMTVWIAEAGTYRISQMVGCAKVSSITYVDGPQKTMSVTQGSYGDKSFAASWLLSTGTEYKVNHYWQNITDDNYTLQETETKTGTTESKVTLSGTAKAYPGFNYVNSKVNGNVVTDAEINPDGSLKIDSYYNRTIHELNVNGMLDGTLSDDTVGYAKFNVKLNGTIDGASNEEEYYNQNVRYGSSYEIYNIRPETGYSFVGVSSNSEPLKGTVTKNSNVVLEFKTNTYTITLNANGGSLSGMSTFNKKFGDPIGMFSEPTRNGYEFVGWFDAKTGGTQYTSATKMPASNITLYAQWKQKEIEKDFKIYYHSNTSVSGYDEIVTQGVNAWENFTFKAANTFTHPQGKKFVHWAETPDGMGANYIPDTSLSYYWGQDLHLYAIWEEPTETLEYTVTLNSNLDYGTTEGSGKYTQGTTIQIRAIPNNGNEFVQWSDGVTDNPRNITVNSNIDLTAEFRRITSTQNAKIIYDDNLTGATISQSVNANSSVTIYGSDTFTRSGYTIKNWCTISNGTGYCYAPGSTTYWDETTTTRLFAIWEPTAPKILYGYQDVTSWSSTDLTSKPAGNQYRSRTQYQVNYSYNENERYDCSTYYMHCGPKDGCWSEGWSDQWSCPGSVVWRCKNEKWCNRTVTRSGTTGWQDSSDSVPKGWKTGINSSRTVYNAPASWSDVTQTSSTTTSTTSRKAVYSRDGGSTWTECSGSCPTS